jgi:hypothetical protein
MQSRRQEILGLRQLVRRFLDHLLVNDGGWPPAQE